MWLCVHWDRLHNVPLWVTWPKRRREWNRTEESATFCAAAQLPLPSLECNEGFISGMLVSATPCLNGPIFKLLFFFCQLLLPWQKFGPVWFNWDFSCWWTDMQTPELLYIIFFQHSVGLGRIKSLLYPRKLLFILWATHATFWLRVCVFEYKNIINRHSHVYLLIACYS